MILHKNLSRRCDLVYPQPQNEHLDDPTEPPIDFVPVDRWERKEERRSSSLSLSSCVVMR